MARKGIAVVKKAPKYVGDSGDDEDSHLPPLGDGDNKHAVSKRNTHQEHERSTSDSKFKNIPASFVDVAAGDLKLSSETGVSVPPSQQPRQVPLAGQSDRDASDNVKSLANQLFPKDNTPDTLANAQAPDRTASFDPVHPPSPHECLSANCRSQVDKAASPTATPANACETAKPKPLANLGPKPLDTPPPEPIAFTNRSAMIQGGASIPPNQQRHMRACMVCSIVRTQQQFLTQGCPNCDFLELAGNADGINECTSQVFEGLISVADTTRSWVARYQRLEGYVPGVYAIQVEGNLPEDVLDTIQSAGINYVPRGGTETAMLGNE